MSQIRYDLAMPFGGRFSLIYMGQVIGLRDSVFTIGRSSQCNLTLEDAQISGEHARLRLVEGRLFLESLSEHCVHVNGFPVTDRTELRAGDSLRVGQQTLRVVTRREVHSQHPTVPPEVVSGEGTVDPPVVRGRKPTGTIAIVDDSPTIRDVVRATLESVGYRVLAADTPFEATALIAREQPHLVLVDVGMPGLSGDQVVRFVRTRGDAPDTCIVLYSARPAEELERLAQECNADGFIEKTRNSRDLVEAVAAWAWLWEY